MCLRQSGVWGLGGFFFITDHWSLNKHCPLELSFQPSCVNFVWQHLCIISDQIKLFHAFMFKAIHLTTEPNKDSLLFGHVGGPFEWFFHIIKHSCDESKILSGEDRSGRWEKVILCSLSGWRKTEWVELEEGCQGSMSVRAIIQQTISFSLKLLHYCKNLNFYDVPFLKMTNKRLTMNSNGFQWYKDIRSLYVML